MRKAEQSKEEYQETIAAYNDMIENLHLKYAPLLNQVQDSDDGAIKLVKFNLEKFSKYFNALAKQLTSRCEELGQTLSAVNEQTDL